MGRDLRLDYELRQRELQERSGQLAREYGQQGEVERHRLGLMETERNRLLQQVGSGLGLGSGRVYECVLTCTSVC